jgi:hypothetical protein
LIPTATSTPIPWRLSFARDSLCRRFCVAFCLIRNGIDEDGGMATGVGVGD